MAAAVQLDDLPGLALTFIGGALYVAGWPEGTAPRAPEHLPEDQRTLPELVRVEGLPVVASLVHVLFAGPPGSPAELLLRWHDGTRTRHVLARPGPTASSKSIPVTSDATRTKECELGRFDEHGYLRVRTFAAERTRGLEASVGTVTGPDGATLRFAEHSILDAGRRRLQDDGVYPDIAIPLRWEEVARLGPQAAREAWQARLLTRAAAILDAAPR